MPAGEIFCKDQFEKMNVIQTAMQNKSNQKKRVSRTVLETPTKKTIGASL